MNVARCRSCSTALWPDAARCPVFRVRLSSGGGWWNQQTLLPLLLMIAALVVLSTLLLR